MKDELKAKLAAARLRRVAQLFLVRSMRDSLIFLLVRDYSLVDVTTIDSNLLLPPPPK